MIWAYLPQFWDLLVAVGIYPVEYFQQIGIAVAGALGGFFDVIFHNLNDVFVFFNWLGVNLKNIFVSLLAPISYFFNVLRFFFATAFGALPEVEATYTFSPEILDVFQAIPNWQIFSTILGACIIFIIGLSSLKLLLRT